MSQVPDYFEPIVGYRSWSAKVVKNNFYLASLNSTNQWPCKQVMVASCLMQGKGERACAAARIFGEPLWMRRNKFTGRWDNCGSPSCIESTPDEQCITDCWMSGSSVSCSEIGTWFKLAGIPVFHRAPHKTCTCGIYAYKAAEQNISCTGGGILSGEVWLWGKIQQHKLGYRAQYAYPKSLQGDHAEELSARYGLEYDAKRNLSYTKPDSTSSIIKPSQH